MRLLCAFDGMHAGMCAKAKIATTDGDADADEGGDLKGGDWVRSNASRVGC